MTFRTIRENELEFWCYKTGKDPENHLCEFEGALECKWQSKAEEKFDINHVSIFCSLGDFATHFTDHLKDKRYDNHSFENTVETKILLIASELLTDFQDIYISAEISAENRSPAEKLIKDKNFQNPARDYFSRYPSEIQNFFDYINKVCKHKFSGFHLCNHHINIHFEDLETISQYEKEMIGLKNIKELSKRHSVLIIPQLSEIISLVVSCYEKLDKLFIHDDSKFKFICEHFRN